jgi:hypothetical protein
VGYSDGSIAVGLAGELLRISPTGASESLTKRDEGELFPLYPQILPGGRAILFSADKSRGRPC